MREINLPASLVSFSSAGISRSGTAGMQTDLIWSFPAISASLRDKSSSLPDALSAVPLRRCETLMAQESLGHGDEAYLELGKRYLAETQ